MAEKKRARIRVIRKSDALIDPPGAKLSQGDAKAIKDFQHQLRTAPRGAQPPLQKGSIVHERGAKRMGKIEELGPEVSGVKFDDGTFRYVNMAHLVNKGLPRGRD